MNDSPPPNRVPSAPAAVISLVVLGWLAACSQPPVTKTSELTTLDAAAQEPGPGAAQAGPAPQEARVEPKPEPEYRLPDDYLSFSGACEPGDRLVVAAVGDVLPHKELQRQAAESKARFRSIWEGVADLLAVADITYANLEVPLAPGLDRDAMEVQDPGFEYDGVVYTGYPRFNAHPNLAKDLRASGIDVVSTANNHALDRGMEGIDRTIRSLHQAKLPFTGTRTRDAAAKTEFDKKRGRWHSSIKAELDGHKVSIAFVACTNHTNMKKDEQAQVLNCKSDKRLVKDQIRRLRKRHDAVIVTPHWGKEYSPAPRERQIKRAHEYIDAGALAVFGGHPHVLQPWERYETEDGREGFVIYSLGNFASHQQDLAKRASLILYLGIGRNSEGELFVSGARYVPIGVRQDGQHFFVEALDRSQGPSDAYHRVVSMFGWGNLWRPTDIVGAHDGVAVTTAPHCDERWRHSEAPPWYIEPEPEPAGDAGTQSM